MILLGILLLQSPAVDFLELEGIEVWELDDPRPFRRGGGATQATVRGREGEGSM